MNTTTQMAMNLVHLHFSNYLSKLPNNSVSSHKRSQRNKIPNHQTSFRREPYSAPQKSRQNAHVPPSKLRQARICTKGNPRRLPPTSHLNNHSTTSIGPINTQHPLIPLALDSPTERLVRKNTSPSHGRSVLEIQTWRARWPNCCPRPR